MKTLITTNAQSIQFALVACLIGSLTAAEVEEKPATTTPSDAQIDDIINGDSITGQDRPFEILTQYSLGYGGRVNLGRDSELPSSFSSYDTRTPGWNDSLQVRAKYVAYNSDFDRVNIIGDIKRNNIIGDSAGDWLNEPANLPGGGQPNTWDLTGSFREIHHFAYVDGIVDGGGERIFTVDLNGVLIRYFADIGVSRLSESNAHLNKLTVGADWYRYDTNYERSGTKYNAKYTHAWFYDQTNYFRRLQGELDIGQYNAHSSLFSYRYISPKLTYFYRTGAQIQESGTWDYTASIGTERRDYDTYSPNAKNFGVQIDINTVYAVSAQRWFSTYTFAKITGKLNTRTNRYSAYDDLTGVTLLIGTIW